MTVALRDDRLVVFAAFGTRLFVVNAGEQIAAMRADVDTVSSNGSANGSTHPHAKKDDEQSIDDRCAEHHTEKTCPDSQQACGKDCSAGAHGNK